MDVNTLRSIVTVASLLVFLVVVAYAWSSKRRQAFDEAANLPFVDSVANHGKPEGQ
jgi:cytochrome c oxidase cbb3-type subunit 4